MKSILQSEKYLLLACLVAVAGYAVDPRLGDHGRLASALETAVLVTAILAASVVGLFQETISKYVVLAVLMPIVSGMGGNAGTQTMAVAVRALATNQLTSSNTIRQIVREFRIASANGTALGILIGVSVGLIYGNHDLGLVIAMAMLINNLVAGLAGILVPVTLDRFNVDPAVSSAVFVTTMTDVMGFFSFLGLATIWGL